MDLAHRTAQSVLDHIETDNHEVDRFVRGFIVNVKKYAQKAQKGDAEGMNKVLMALDTIHKRLDGLEKTVSAASTTTTQSTDSVAFWRSLRMNAWQRGTTGAPTPPVDRSNGTSSPGVSEVELQEDRQVIVKIADQGSRERFRRRDVSEKDIVQQVDKRIVTAALKTPSSALAAARVVAARKLPSGDVALFANTAATAEVLRIHASGWLQVFGPGATVQVPTWEWSFGVSLPAWSA